MASSEQAPRRRRPPRPVDTPYLEEPEAAAYLRVSQSHFIEHVRPHITTHFVGRKPIYHRDDLDSYMEKHITPPTKAPRVRGGSASHAAKRTGKAARIAKELQKDGGKAKRTNTEV